MRGNDRFMKNFIIKGNLCQSLTLDKLDFKENAYIVVEDGVSAGVFDSIPEEYASYELIDYGNALIFPGMVDLHIHAPQYAFRGMCMDLELMEWLRSYTFPEEEKYSDTEYAKLAYGIFADALKHSATTRACIFATIHKDSTELLMDIMEDSGIVSYVGKVNMDRGAGNALTEESAEVSARDTRLWINETKNKFKRTMPILTPRFIPSCTDELLLRLGEIENEFGVPVQSHLSESGAEIDYVMKMRPKNKFYGDVYDEYGLFGKNNVGLSVNTVMAHCVWSTEDEISLMKRNGVFVAHCPSSNMNLASGIAPIRSYLDRGMRVGLGTDVAAGHSESVFRAMTDAICVSKLYYRHVDSDKKPITFPEAFYMATKGGGEFFGKVGCFDKGYEFDAVVLDDSVIPSPRRLTLAERAERAVYLGLDERGIIAKYVRGRELIK